MPDPEQTTQATGTSQAQAPAKPPAPIAQATPPATKAEPQPEPERGFTIAGWKERARRHLHVSPHAVAGALHDVEGDELVTEEEIKQRLEEFGGLPGSEAIRKQLEEEDR